MGDAHCYGIAPRLGWCIKLLSGYNVIYAGRKPATVRAVGTTYGKLGYKNEKETDFIPYRV